jgi:hypothetical protein
MAYAVDLRKLSDWVVLGKRGAFWESLLLAAHCCSAVDRHVPHVTHDDLLINHSSKHYHVI